MVNFLIHNTLGAWWAGKALTKNPVLAEQAETEKELRRALSLPGVSWDYLRFVRTNDGKGPWRPAAGIFEGWPKLASELKILDPCCGSGHFLVALLNHLVPIRIADDGLSIDDAMNAVLQDSLYGLEIEERCTQISVFALALAAWTFPDCDGYRQLPKMNIASSGVAPNIEKKNWIEIAGNDVRLIKGMASLYELFKEAPTLGSLINPVAIKDEPLFKAGFNELRPLLEEIFSRKKHDYEKQEIGVSALGIAGAVKILGGNYHLVITNVPYLTRGKQVQKLRSYLEKYHDFAKQDLATALVERGLLFCAPGGSMAFVTPQNWLFLDYYKKLREKILKENTWNFVAKLGSKAFQTPMWDYNVMLVSITQAHPNNDQRFAGIDAALSSEYIEKDNILKGDITTIQKGNHLNKTQYMVFQREQLRNPKSRIVFETATSHKRLYEFAEVYKGICTGDYPRFGRCFWEVSLANSGWEFQQSTTKLAQEYGGMEHVLYWENGSGELINFVEERLSKSNVSSWIRGTEAWGKKGITVSIMNDLPVSLYTGSTFDNNVSVLIPQKTEYLLPIWTFCCSDEFPRLVRQLNAKLSISDQTFIQVPFDVERWKKVSKEKYPDGLPRPYSNEPTQWLFKGSIIGSLSPLHVAVARLLGFSWPMQEKEELDESAHSSGIVCLPSIRGQEPASEGFRVLLATAFGSDWSPGKEGELIVNTSSRAKDLEDWLRDDFFEQQSKLFHHRPFIWHIWDGRRRDGFHALVNYHKLSEANGRGRQLLENLTYSYLGDWITRQKEEIKQGKGGAEERLDAALELQKRLIAIIEGEPPFDIFIRWKPIEEQPIGWEPDINDGVRLNIRPFMAQDIPGGRKGAGILRWKPNIKWNKDRGKEPYRSKEQYPWFWKDSEFTGDRVNDIHLSNEEKRQAREKAKKK